MKTLRIVIWKEFQQIRRDKFSLRLMIAMPIVQLLLLGYALNQDVTNLRFASLDSDDTPHSRSLLRKLGASDRFIDAGEVSSREEALALLDRGRIQLALIIPPDWSEQLETALDAFPDRAQSGEPAKAATASLQLLLDGQDANSAGVAMGYVRAITAGWAQEMLFYRLRGEGLDPDELLPVSADARILYNPELRSSWYMIPGIVVLLVTMVTSLLTSFSIVREKESGTLEQLLVTPIAARWLIVGKTIPYLVIGLAEMLAALGIGMLWYRLPFRGDLLMLVGYTFVYVFSSLGIGILVSTLVKSQQQALFLIWFFLIFFLLTSGFLMPVENMPTWTQWLTEFNPVKHFLIILREVVLKGTGPGFLLPEVLKLAALGLALYLIAVISFTRRTA